MMKIPDIYHYKVQSCPSCGGKKISLAIDTVIGYWYAFCEDCGHKGKESKFEKLRPSTETPK